MVSLMVSHMVIGSLHCNRSLILKAQESRLLIRQGATHSVVVEDRRCRFCSIGIVLAHPQRCSDREFIPVHPQRQIGSLHDR